MRILRNVITYPTLRNPGSGLALHDPSLEQAREEQIEYDESAVERLILIDTDLRLENVRVDGFAAGRRTYWSIRAQKLCGNGVRWATRDEFEQLVLYAEHVGASETNVLGRPLVYAPTLRSCQIVPYGGDLVRVPPERIEKLCALWLESEVLDSSRR
jgi:hypothetical protein